MLSFFIMYNAKTFAVADYLHYNFKVTSFKIYCI